MAESLILRKGGGGVSEFSQISLNWTGTDTTAYVGGVLIIRTWCLSRTGGNCCGGANYYVYGYNPSTSSWDTLCASAVGGATSDAYLVDQDVAIFTNNIYTSVKVSSSSWSNAYGTGGGSVVGGK